MPLTTEKKVFFLAVLGDGMARKHVNLKKCHLAVKYYYKDSSGWMSKHRITFLWISKGHAWCNYVGSDRLLYATAAKLSTYEISVTWIGKTNSLNHTIRKLMFIPFGQRF